MDDPDGSFAREILSDTTGSFRAKVARAFLKAADTPKLALQAIELVGDRLEGRPVQSVRVQERRTTIFTGPPAAETEPEKHAPQTVVPGVEPDGSVFPPVDLPERSRDAIAHSCGVLREVPRRRQHGHHGPTIAQTPDCAQDEGAPVVGLERKSLPVRKSHLQRVVQRFAVYAAQRHVRRVHHDSIHGTHSVLRPCDEVRRTRGPCESIPFSRGGGDVDSQNSVALHAERGHLGNERSVTDTRIQPERIRVPTGCSYHRRRKRRGGVDRR